MRAGTAQLACFALVIPALPVPGTAWWLAELADGLHPQALYLETSAPYYGHPKLRKASSA